MTFAASTLRVRNDGWQSSTEADVVGFAYVGVFAARV